MWYFWQMWWDGQQDIAHFIETPIEETTVETEELITGRYWTMTRIVPSSPLYTISEEFR